MARTPANVLELIADTSQHVVPDVLEDLDDMLAYRLTTGPRPTMGVFKLGRKRPMVTISKNRDGTISIASEHSPHGFNHTPIAAITRELNKILITEVSARIFQKVTASPLKHEFVNVCANGDAGAYTAAVRKQAAGIINKAARNYSQDGEAKISAKSPVATIAAAVNRHFTDPEIISQACLRIHGQSYYRSSITFAQYNDIVLNESTYRRMDEEAPNVLRAFQVISDHNHEGMRLPTPDHVTRYVRDYMALTPYQWRILTHTEYQRSGRDSYVPGIRYACRLLADVNLTDHHPQIAEAIGLMTARHQWADRDDLNWSHGAVWPAWVHVFHQAMRSAPRYAPTVHFHATTLQAELGAVLNAFTYAIRHDLPWGKTDWDSYVRRSRRILALMDQDERHVPSYPEDDLSWESLIDEMRVDDFTVHPITTTESLHNTAVAMDNHIGRYARACHRGDFRVFTLRWQNQVQAVIILGYSEGRWTLHSVEKHHSRPGNPEHITAAVQVARHYDRAQAQAQPAPTA